MAFDGYGSYIVLPYPSNAMRQRFFYNTWLTASQSIIGDASGMCSERCPSRIVNQLPNKKCLASELTYPEHCYPVLDREVVFHEELLRETEAASAACCDATAAALSGDHRGWAGAMARANSSQ